MPNRFILIFGILLLIGFSSCKKDDPTKSTTAYTLVQPYKFPLFPDGVDEGLTEEGIALGRRLFYDPILSGDSTMACATCHIQADGFSDKRQFSIGIDGSVGTRQAMPIVNVAWSNKLFWDGRVGSIEEQALEPVENPIEMKAHWNIVVENLKTNSLYLELFDDAFPGQEITKDLAADAIAQFEKTIISSTSKYDRILNGPENFTESEHRGYDLFFSEKADCFHCHDGTLISNLGFHNNGLDADHSADIGLQAVTNNPNDRGKFKTPSLRNISFTAPYMHDGRFATIDEVIEFYSSGLQASATIDELMKNVAQGGVQLTAEEKTDLKAFLLLFDDEEFITNPAFSSPF